MKHYILFVFLFMQHVVASDKLFDEMNHHRSKRWLNFPKGSSLQLVYCWLISTYGTRDGIFTVGITVGLAWEIPVDLKKAFDSGRSLHDEQRRDLHYKIEKFINQQGENGTACVKKAICDAKEIPKGSKLTFMQAILHTIFRLDSDDDVAPVCQDHVCSYNLFKQEQYKQPS